MGNITRPLEVIESEINFYKTQTATGIIEIGKRLIEAKEQIPFGEWGKWLKEKVEFSERTARQFMRVAEEFGDSENGKRFPISKLYALLDIPADKRDEFIKENPVDDMTTRQLQEAIQEKKRLEKLLEDEKNKPSKEVPPPDYELLKSRVEIKDKQIESLEREIEILKSKAKMNEKDAERYQDLQEQIELLSRQKDDIGRIIRSTTELSALTVEAREFFKSHLAPIKYSRAIQEACQDPIIRSNLSEILEIFQSWIDEMNSYISNHKNVIEVEGRVINE